MLKNKVLLSTLQNQGFVNFPFIEQDRLKKIIDLYAEYEVFHVPDGKYYHTTFHIGDKQLSTAVNKGIYDLIGESLDFHFENYSLFTSNFMIKESGLNSEVPPHQDWTYVDETLYQSINIWIPLEDVNIGNGCLTFLPGSHSIMYSHRTSPYCPSVFEKVMPLVRSRMKPVPAKAGEAVVFYNSTLHGSTPNISGKKRLAIVQGIYSKEAQLQHLFVDKETGKISQYNISVDDFHKMKNLERPTFLKPVQEFPPQFPQLTKSQFLKHYPESTIKKLKRWIASIGKL